MPIYANGSNGTVVSQDSKACISFGIGMSVYWFGAAIGLVLILSHLGVAFEVSGRPLLTGRSLVKAVSLLSVVPPVISGALAVLISRIPAVVQGRRIAAGVVATTAVSVAGFALMASWPFPLMTTVLAIVYPGILASLGAILGGWSRNLWDSCHE
jgi:hypothetical protein